MLIVFLQISSTHTIYQLLTDSTGPNLVLSGNRNSTSMRNQGTYGLYWSSTAYSSATYAYRLYLDSSGAVSPAYYIDKYYGFSLRCLAATLYTHYPNYTSMTNSAGPEFVLSGHRSSTSMYNQGTYGYYWSSTAYSSATNAYSLNLGNSGAVNPAGNGVKYYGFSLRCLAPPTPSTNYSLTPLDQTLC